MEYEGFSSILCWSSLSLLQLIGGVLALCIPLRSVCIWNLSEVKTLLPGLQLVLCLVVLLEVRIGLGNDLGAETLRDTSGVYQGGCSTCFARSSAGNWRTMRCSSILTQDKVKVVIILQKTFFLSVFLVFSFFLSLPPSLPSFFLYTGILIQALCLLGMHFSIWTMSLTLFLQLFFG
jgi:hypothetical protein